MASHRTDSRTTADNPETPEKRKAGGVRGVNFLNFQPNHPTPIFRVPGKVVNLSHRRPGLRHRARHPL